MGGVTFSFQRSAQQQQAQAQQLAAEEAARWAAEAAAAFDLEGALVELDKASYLAAHFRQKSLQHAPHNLKVYGAGQMMHAQSSFEACSWLETEASQLRAPSEMRRSAT